MPVLVDIESEKPENSQPIDYFSSQALVAGISRLEGKIPMALEL